MAVLAAGQSRPLCLKAALAHVTLHTSWALCPGSPTPDRGWQWCQGQGEGCLDTLVEPGGSLEREREPEAHTAEFPNSGIHILMSQAHPTGEAVSTQLSGKKNTPQRSRGAAATWSSEESGKNLSSLHGPLLPEFGVQVKAHKSSPPAPLEGAGTCAGMVLRAEAI